MVVPGTLFGDMVAKRIDKIMTDWEDVMDDAAYEDWDDVATSRGEKWNWEINKVFIGKYLGKETVELGSSAAFPDEKAPALLFTDPQGDPWWMWIPAGLKKAFSPTNVNPINPGALVRIECEGYDDSYDPGPGQSKMFKFNVKVKR